MKRLLLLALIIILSVSMLACNKTSAGEINDDKTNTIDEKGIKEIVEAFGKKLQNVSLLSPKDVLEKSMKENYSEYVTQELIAKWISDPSNSPGRQTSSPWPDRIEIIDTKQLSETSYQVDGKIIEVANEKDGKTGIVAKRPISLIVKAIDTKWLISEVTLGKYEEIAPTDKPEAVIPENFFPVSVGSTWEFLGEGNEYAAFVRKALFKEGDRAQFSEDNGGTVSASIFKVTEKEIVRTFLRGEEYNNENLMKEKANDATVILKAPLKAGTKWKNSGDNREIVATDAVVETPAGKFTDCIKVSIKTDNSTMYEYFKAGVGMVKREFVSEGMTVTSTLEKYEIK